MYVCAYVCAFSHELASTRHASYICKHVTRVSQTAQEWIYDVRIYKHTSVQSIQTHHYTVTNSCVLNKHRTRTYTTFTQHTHRHSIVFCKCKWAQHRCVQQLPLFRIHSTEWNRIVININICIHKYTYLIFVCISNIWFGIKQISCRVKAKYGLSRKWSKRNLVYGEHVLRRKWSKRNLVNQLELFHVQLKIVWQ